MTKRWPNIETWRLVVGELKKTHGSRGRRSGEAIFGVGRGELRAWIDRELTDDEAAAIEAMLAALHRQRIARLKECVAVAEHDAQAFREKRTRRETERHRTRFDESQDEIGEIISEHYKWFIRNLQEEGA